jgi:hypothetical protein
MIVAKTLLAGRAFFYAGCTIAVLSFGCAAPAVAQTKIKLMLNWKY